MISIYLLLDLNSKIAQNGLLTQPHIAFSQRSPPLQLNVPLTVSLLCSKFIELTLFTNIPSQMLVLVDIKL